MFQIPKQASERASENVIRYSTQWMAIGKENEVYSISISRCRELQKGFDS